MQWITQTLHVVILQRNLRHSVNGQGISKACDNCHTPQTGVSAVRVLWACQINDMSVEKWTTRPIYRPQIHNTRLSMNNSYFCFELEWCNSICWLIVGIPHIAMTTTLPQVFTACAARCLQRLEDMVGGCMAREVISTMLWLLPNIYAQHRRHKCWRCEYLQYNWIILF